MRLIADGRLVWIMRELADGPLRPVELRDRIGRIPHTTLLEKLDLLVRSGVIVREERGGRAAGVLQHLSGAGTALLDLADSVLESLRSDPTAPQLVFGSSSGPPALRVLADDATPDLLLALAGRPQRAANLERSLHLSRSQLDTRLKALELAKYVSRESDRYFLNDAGRETTAFLVSAARLEEKFSLPGATKTCPRHIAALLTVAVPLVPLPTAGADLFELTVECGPGEGDESEAICLLRSGPGNVLSAELAPTRNGTASARAGGPVKDWCAALIDGQIEALRFGGEPELMTQLISDLHERLFDDGPEKLLVSQSVSSVDQSD